MSSILALIAITNTSSVGSLTIGNSPIAVIVIFLSRAAICVLNDGGCDERIGMMKVFRHFWRGSAIAAGLLAASLSIAVAQTAPLPLPSDQSTLHLSETAQRDVPRDLLRATLAAEATDPDAGKVQSDINQRMSAAMTRIKQIAGVTVETGGYSVYRETPDKQPPRWHGSQTVSLTSKDFAALLGLAGALQQQGLVIQSLSPDISREARQSVEDALTDEALTRLKQRADRIATTAGVKLQGIRMLTVGNVNAPPPIIQPMMRMAVSAAPMPPPVAEAGNATVSITATADFALARP
jgi:predicted secreted protein